MADRYTVEMSMTIEVERGPTPAPAEIEKAVCEYLDGQQIHVPVDLPGNAFAGSRIVPFDLTADAVKASP